MEDFLSLSTYLTRVNRCGNFISDAPHSTTLVWISEDTCFVRFSLRGTLVCVFKPG